MKITHEGKVVYVEFYVLDIVSMNKNESFHVHSESKGPSLLMKDNGGSGDLNSELRK